MIVTVDWKTLRATVATAAAILGLGVAYIQLGLPIYATRSWTTSEMRPWIVYALQTRRLANGNAKFAWESENPRPFTQPVQAQIDALVAENAEIDRQLALIKP